MKKFCLALASAGLFLVSKSSAISLDDIQLWTGSGTNRAALVIEWNSPVAFNQSTVPAPVTEKTMVWGCRFNGTITGTQLFDAVVAADRRLYVVETIDSMYGPFVQAIGYNLKGNGLYGISDGSNTYHAGDFTNGLLIDPNLNPDAAVALNGGDLYWGGHYGPNWQTWSEANYSGGFTNSPNRGTNQYYDPSTFAHGQWWSGSGLEFTTITNGSWLGFSVTGAGYPLDPNDTNDLAIYNTDEQAPPSPDGTYAAYVCNTNDFAVQIVSTNNIDHASPYNDPTAILNRPTLRFYDPFDGNVTDRVSVIDPPFNVTPAGGKVITEIKTAGQITVNMGRRIYDDPNNPYGIDFIVYGNSFFSASGASGFISDATDLDTTTLGSSPGGHPTIVSVSQDGTNWYTYPTTTSLFADEAYRWDDTNASWTSEEMNPTKPLNPYIDTNNFGGQSVASGLDQFIGAAGGTGYALKSSGFPWIQYVRVQAETNANQYTVIDAIAAVDPVVVGDALSITPDNLAAGITNLSFQEPDNSSNTLISLNFDSVSGTARISTISLSEFSSFAPVFGNASSGYQITAKPLTGSSTLIYSADVGLRAGDSYTGNGSDLRLYQWNGAGWTSQPFSFNAALNRVVLAGVTNFSALVVSQIVPPRLNVSPATNGLSFQFTPVPNCAHTLVRTFDFVNWTPVASVTPTDSQPVTLQDNAPPAGKAFYRLQVNIP
jgi:hypothetical protein